MPHLSPIGSWRALPADFKRFLVAVAVFGCGDFAHTLLILFAAQRLSPSLGQASAAAIATSLYLLHNTLYAGFAFVGGWLGDRFPKRPLLAAGYSLAALMSIALVALPASVASLILVFSLGGIYVALEETLEDSLCAELVPPGQHGMAFGTLATVNGVGDFASSVLVGALWTAFGTGPAFTYSAALSVIGAGLMMLQRAR